MEATYSDFIPVNNNRFPQNIVVTFFSSTPVIMKVGYAKVTCEETLSMPFSIPEKYERR